MRTIAALLIFLSGPALAGETWECAEDTVFNDWSEILVVATSDPENHAGKIGVAGVTHNAKFLVRGFNRTWVFGCAKDNCDYMFVIQPNRKGDYVDFSDGSGDAKRASQTYQCRQRGNETSTSQVDPETQKTESTSNSSMAAYMFAIQQRVTRNWVRPPSATPGLECEVNIRQIPGGEVVSVSIGKCNGDTTVRQSIEAAVQKASPLPTPADPTLFDQDIRLNFRPD